MPSSPLTRFASIIVCAALVASCGSGDSDETAATDQTTTSGATTTSETTTTIEATTSLTDAPVETTAETPAPTTAQTCPTSTIYPGVDSPHVLADVNGDNELDTTFTRQIGDQWFAVVEYGGGGSSFITLVDSDPVSSVFVIGPVDFTSTGAQELAVAVGSGAYTTEVGFIRSRDCELIRLAFETSAPAGFLSGASVGNFSGMLCGPGLVEQYEFTLDANAAEPSYEGGFTPYTLEGDTFVKGFGDGTILTADELASIRTFDCFGLEL